MVGALAYDIGKAAAAEQFRKIMGNHAVAGMAFVGKNALEKKSPIRAVVMSLVKEHHGEIKGLAAEKIRAAHLGGGVEEVTEAEIEELGAESLLIEDTAAPAEVEVKEVAIEKPHPVEHYNGLIAPELQEPLPF